MNHAATPRPSSGELAGSTLVLAVVLALGLLNLYFPFSADQGVMLLAARSLERGGVLYVDFWDNKMPGLVWFYWAAGALFGLDERGVHTLELIYLGVFSVVLIATMRRELHPPWLAAVVPLAVVGTYFVSALAFELTQLEILSAFPIYLSLWCARQCVDLSARTVRYGLASGAFAGIAVCFKLVFAPILVAGWVIVACYLWRDRPRGDGWWPFGLRLLRFGGLPVLAGLGAVLAAVTLKFWIDGGLSALLWTAFVYPTEALDVITRASYVRLLETAGFFASYYLAWFGFMVVCVVWWWQGERDRWTAILIAWFVLGAAAIAIQQFSWWSYHALILFTPAGLLGVKGVSATFAWLSSSGREFRTGHTGRALGLALVLCLPPVATLAVPVRDKCRALIETLIKAEKGTIFDYQALMRPDYRKLRRSSAFLRRDDSAPGSIYVFGDPLMYRFAERDPALPIPGFAWKYFLQSQWRMLVDQLQAAQPPYIYIDHENGKHMLRRGAGVWDYIKRDYRMMSTDEGGFWFEKRG